MKWRKVRSNIILIVMLFILCGCAQKDSATSNRKMNTQATEEETVETTIEETTETNPEEMLNSEETITFSEASTSTEIKKIGYDVDLETDISNFDGNVDITVGDNYYTTQINDWYVNFDQYEGKVVQIEGFYINDFWPYTFVGRYGPVCPYCNGGYVSFEFYTDEDVSNLKSLEDWIRVTGILRKGEDTNGIFYYIETLKMEIMDEPGMETVTN